MDGFISVGFGNSVNFDKLIAVMEADTLPAKRLVSAAKQEGRLLDATGGRRTKAVLVLSENYVMQCGLHTETICQRLNGDKNAQDEQ